MTTTESDLTIGTILYLDPDELVPDPDNSRGELRDIDAMAASIASIGVQTPIKIRYVDTNGSSPKNAAKVPMIIFGHRRQAGASRAKAQGHEKAQLVPCMLASDEEASDALVRGVERLAENLQRDDFNAAEEARAVQQLLDLGIDEAAIAASSGVAVLRVQGAAKIAGSKATRAVAEKHDLTFDQALGIAEFDGDKETVKALTAAAVKEPEEFPHVLSAARQERQDAETIAAETVIWKEKGYAVLDEQPGYNEKASPIHRLTLKKGTKGDVTEKNHVACPGRAVLIDVLGNGQTWTREYCTDWKANGHGRDEYFGGGGSSQGSMQRPEKTEKEKTEDRIHRAGMKASRAAREVRVQFVKDLLKRKAVPAGLYRFSVETILSERFEDSAMAGELVGKAGYRPLGAYAKSLPDARLPFALFARVAGQLEQGWEANTWQRGGGWPEVRRAYLRLLVSAGYVPSLVEKVFLGQAKPQAVLDENERLKAAAKLDAASRPRPAPAKASAPAKKAPAKKAARRRAPAKKAVKRIPARRAARS